jgi:NTP pyrophosphatase (non-canonical NTP hydrolase)
MANPQIPQEVRLSAAQKFIGDFVQERIATGGWDNASGPELCMLLAEEMGEVAKEVRRLHFKEKLKDSTPTDLSHELVDMLNYICRIANTYGLDLEKAYREKNTEILGRFPD